MSYLVDTNCISELAKKEPDQKVVRWFSDHEELELYLSVITFGELRKGIEKLTNADKRRRLRQWVNEDLHDRFEGRIIDISLQEVNEWGWLLARADNQGTPMPAIDALIAATASVHQFSVVTRKVGDMKAAGVRLINPWEYNGN